MADEMSVALMMAGFGMGQRVQVVVVIVQQMSEAGWVLRYVKAAGSVAMSGGVFHHGFTVPARCPKLGV